MYKTKDGKFVKVKQDKKQSGQNAGYEEKLQDMQNTIQIMSENVQALTEYAYMPDPQLTALAKEKGIDGRIKDRKVIVDTLMGKEEQPPIGPVE